jgi:hypothetical protein
MALARKRNSEALRDSSVSTLCCFSSCWRLRFRTARLVEKIDLAQAGFRVQVVELRAQSSRFAAARLVEEIDLAQAGLLFRGMYVRIPMKNTYIPGYTRYAAHAPDEFLYTSIPSTTQSPPHNTHSKCCTPPLPTHIRPPPFPTNSPVLLVCH